MMSLGATRRCRRESQKGELPPLLTTGRRIRTSPAAARREPECPHAALEAGRRLPMRALVALAARRAAPPARRAWALAAGPPPRRLATPARAGAWGSLQPNGGADLKARALNDLIREASTPAGALKFVDEYGAALGASSVALIYHRLGDFVYRGGPSGRAKLLDECAPGLESLRSALDRAAPALGARDVAHTARALARLRGAGWLDDLRAVSSHALRRLPAFDPAERTILLWALSHAAGAEPELYGAVATSVARRAAELSAAQLASVARSMARAHVPSDALCAAVAAEVCARPHALPPSAAATVAYSLARAREQAAEAAEAARKGERASAGAVSAASAQPDAPPDAPPRAHLDATVGAAFRALAGACSADARRFDGHALSNMVWAYVHAEHAHTAEAQRLLCGLARAAPPLLPSCPPLALASLARDVSREAERLGAPAHDLLDAIAAEAAGRIDEFECPQSLANLGWAYAVRGVHDEALAAALAARLNALCAAAGGPGGAGFSNRHQWQLHQLAVSLELDSPGGLEGLLDGALRAELAERAEADVLRPETFHRPRLADLKRRWDAAGRRSGEEPPQRASHLSPQHRGLSKTLWRLGVPHDNSVCVRGYLADVKLRPADPAGAPLPPVLLDITAHSAYAPDGALRAHVQMKHRHWRQLGHVVVAVPYWEWRAQGTLGERVGYLNRRLAPHLALELAHRAETLQPPQPPRRGAPRPHPAGARPRRAPLARELKTGGAGGGARAH